MRLFEVMMKKSRDKKHVNFLSFCLPQKENSILDVGVSNEEYRPTDNYLEKKYTWP
jgi:hypothetical protein